MLLSAEDSKAEDKEQDSLAELGAKLSNPVSDVWALFTESDLFFSDDDVNRGDAKIGGGMLFQPVLPSPLYGIGENAWKLITRPTIPVLFSQPVPKGFGEFNNLGGLGDIQLPMMVSPPSGNWLLGLGPTWLVPSATRDVLGRQQWGVGPAFIIGYRTKEWLAGIFPSTLGESEVGMVKARPAPAISPCSISSSTTCPIPGGPITSLDKVALPVVLSGILIVLGLFPALMAPMVESGAQAVLRLVGGA